MTTYFISDLHLSENRQDITDCFLNFLHELENERPDALYILGDLFEMWIGDDESNPFLKTIRSALRRLTSVGIPCFFIHGNRDFLIGHQFSRETGVQLLDEHTVIDLYGQPTLLLHGDTLCTDDKEYQKFRKRVHMRWLQTLFLALPLKWRVNIGQKIRSQSAQSNQQKSGKVLNVALADTEQQFTRHNVTRIIHGHTHQPNTHQHSAGERIVLGDWYDQGSILRCNRDGQCELLTRHFS
ncbi:UDP-2,3-diacylglucosamine diphosphatase [Thaumasiovibrio sp. DFM-14]|uniref:UDP-2,3-diacylglucosamine diphosphatase n=1 Tax=Thaumasiovibrio sp. DFM-14 TaxID=3384792 RepID=UPI0039A3B5D5